MLSQETYNQLVMSLPRKFIDLVVKKKKFVIIFVAVCVVSFLVESFIFQASSLVFSVGISCVGVLLMFQYFLFNEMKVNLYHRLKELKTINDHQERINRNLMLAIEEIIDIQKQKS